MFWLIGVWSGANLSMVFRVAQHICATSGAGGAFARLLWPLPSIDNKRTANFIGEAMEAGGAKARRVHHARLYRGSLNGIWEGSGNDLS